MQAAEKEFRLHQNAVRMMAPVKRLKRTAKQPMGRRAGCFFSNAAVSRPSSLPKKRDRIIAVEKRLLPELKKLPLSSNMRLIGKTRFAVKETDAALAGESDGKKKQLRLQLKQPT